MSDKADEMLDMISTIQSDDCTDEDIEEAMELSMEYMDEKMEKNRGSMTLREEAIERIIELADPPDEQFARAVMEEEEDDKIFERLERLEHNASTGVQRGIDRNIKKMAKQPGFYSNKPLD